MERSWDLEEKWLAEKCLSAKKATEYDWNHNLLNLVGHLGIWAPTCFSLKCWTPKSFGAFSIDRETRKTWTKSDPSCHSFDSCQVAPSFGPAMNRHEKKPNSPSVLHDFVTRPSWSPMSHMRVQGVVKNVQIVTPGLISTILTSAVRISTFPYCIHFFPLGSYSTCKQLLQTTNPL